MGRRGQEILVRERSGRPPFSRRTTTSPRTENGPLPGMPSCGSKSLPPARKTCLALGHPLVGRKSRFSNVMGEETLRLLPVRPTAPGRAGTGEADTGMPLPEVSASSLSAPAEPVFSLRASPADKAFRPAASGVFPRPCVSLLSSGEKQQRQQRGKSAGKNKNAIYCYYLIFIKIQRSCSGRKSPPSPKAPAFVLAFFKNSGYC